MRFHRRIFTHQLFLISGGIAIETPQTAWPDFKPNTVFGQLPHLKVDGFEISQSMAIARVLSRRAKLEGASESDFATSEMLMEQFCDIIGSVANAKSAPDQYAARRFQLFLCSAAPPQGSHPRFVCRGAAWAAMPAKFANLFGPVSKLLGDKPSFTSMRAVVIGQIKHVMSNSGTILDHEWRGGISGQPNFAEHAARFLRTHLSLQQCRVTQDFPPTRLIASRRAFHWLVAGNGVGVRRGARQDGGRAAVGGDVQRADVREGKDCCFFKKCGVD